MARFEDVLTTKANYSVAGFGRISAVTTHLCGHLVGKELRLVNSAWPGYSGGTSACAIDGVAPNLNWPSGNAPALIVCTVDDGYRYAFRPDQIWPSIPPAARTLAQKEMTFIALRDQLERGFTTPRPDAPLPELEDTHSPLDPELRRLRKVVWLSERLGYVWSGSADQLAVAYTTARERAQPGRADNQARRVRTEANRAQNELYAHYIYA